MASETSSLEAGASEPVTSDSDSLLAHAAKDAQSITADWVRPQELIEGVAVKEPKNVCKASGDVLCEVFRADWALDSGTIDQVFQSTLLPGSITAWPAHRLTTDRLFVTSGLIQIVLYDDRPDSATRGLLNVFRYGTARPGLVVIPPGIWHGVQNISDTPALLLNLVDKAYQYDDPDHWRLPVDTDRIPYTFERR
jgi:dTDP-4-dehydrorhamnose 3,5-epimerase